MNSNITRYEYEKLIFGKDQQDLNEALNSFYGESGVPYFDLIRNGVRFKQFVGVIQVGKYTIEVLPKIDKENQSDEVWKNILITMLRQSGLIYSDAPSQADLNLKSNSILDLYFEIFIKECEFLLKRGLVKKYRKIESNQNALRGSIVFSRHISKNLVHKERFWTRNTVYDRQYLLNQILYKALSLIGSLSIANVLKSRLGALLLDWPEMDDVKVNDLIFSKIQYDRKTLPYKKAIEIARLILLNYHPDIVSGKNNVLALMFDMNILWEKWVGQRMQRFIEKGDKIHLQNSKDFWRPDDKRFYSKTLRPDIILYRGEKLIIMDTKWKIPKDDKPADDDLKQMFAYNQRFNSQKSILIYPGKKEGYSGDYYEDNGVCELRFLDVIENSILSEYSLKELMASL